MVLDMFHSYVAQANAKKNRLVCVGVENVLTI